jgi:ATP-binding cassette subfamily F protein 3
VTILFLSNLEAKIAALLLEMQENTADFVKLGELQAEIDLFNDEKDEIEMTLLEAMEELENL